MLTRRQARLLGLTRGEDDSVSGCSVTAPPPSAADAAYRSSRDSGSAACRARSSERLRDEGSRSPLTVRSSTTGTPSCSAPTSTSECHTNPLLVYLASSVASVPHGNGGDQSSCTAYSSSSPVRLEDCQVEILLSKAQATIHYWAAMSTTAGPLIRFASDSASRSDSCVTRLTRRVASMRRSTNSFPTSMAGARCPGRAARLTAAQLRTRWRGVTRDCGCIQASTRNTPSESGGPHASGRGMSSARRVGLPATVSPTSWSPRAVFGARGQAGVVMCSGDFTVGGQLATRATKPRDMSPHHRLTLSTSPPYADVSSPPLVSRAAAVVDTTRAAAGASSIACYMPTTAFTLRHWKERIYAQRQRRLCLEVHYQAHIRACEARMRLLFAHSDTNGCSDAIKSPDVFAQGRSVTALTSLKSVPGEDMMPPDEDVYLRSLDPTKSDEEAKVLRSAASIEAALRRHLARAYTHTPRLGFSLQGTTSDGNACAADVRADEPSEGFFTAHRSAILEATIADATRSVEAFTRQLLPYQQEGVRWLLRLNVVEHMNGILADDMGLGKTAQAIVYLSCYKDLVEEVVQRPLEELQQRQVYLCQDAVGPTAVATGGGAVARGVDGIEGLSVPRWLEWCTEVAAGTEKTLGGAERDRQHNNSNVKSLATPFSCHELDASGRPLAATATGLCSGYIQLVKEVKQWLWKLGQGTGEGGVETMSGGNFHHVPYHSTPGRKRRKRDSDDDRANGDMREVQPLSVAAVPPVKRRRGRPLKSLSAMMPSATAAARPAGGPSTSIEVASAKLESAVASPTHVSAFSLPVNQQLERELLAFRPVLIIAPLCTLSHWSGEFQRFSRRDGDVAGSLRPCGSSAAERFAVYVVNGSHSEQELRTREFLTHVERLTQKSSTEGGVICDPVLPRTGGSAAKPTTPVLIIPHEMLVKPLCGALCCVRRIEWHVVVMDLAQSIKSIGIDVLHEVCELRCVSRLVLTDTPHQKNATELYSLIRFSTPQTFASRALFEQLDSAFLAANRPARLGDRGFHTLLCRYLHRILLPFILRREREILKTALSPMRDFVVLCPLLPLQKARAGEVVRSHQAGSPLGSLHMLYRNVLLHPCAAQTFYNVDEEVLRISGKLLVLDFMMCFLKRTQHRFLVFSRCTVMLDVVETLCDMRGIPSVRLDNMTPVERRAENSQSRRRSTAATPKDAAERACGGSAVVRDGALFSPSCHWNCLRDSANALGDPLRGMDKEGRVCDDAALDSALTCCVLMSKDGADVGLNLQTADTIFLLDVDQHPQRDAQIVSRVYRVGQRNEVRIFRLVTDHRIEHGFLSLHEAGDTRVRAVVQAGSRGLCSSVREGEAPQHSVFPAAALSHLSLQWPAVAAPSAGDGPVDVEEIEGDEESLSAPAPPFPCMPSTRHPWCVGAGAVGEVEETKGALPSRASKLSRGLKVGDGEESKHVHTDHSIVFQVANGGADLHHAALALGSSSSSSSSFCFSSRLSISADTTKGSERMNSSMTFPVSHRRRPRHISFKSDISSSEGGDIKANRSGAAVKSVAGTTGPLLCSTTPPHPNMRAAVRDTAPDASSRVLGPAGHLLAMRDRFEEVLLRHDGDRRVLDDMFRSLESSFGSVFV